MRQMVVVELEFHIAAFGDPDRVFKGLVQLREALAQLGFRLHVEFVGLKPQPVFFVHGLSGLDAQQDILGGRILAAQIVGVVGHHQGQAGFPGQAQQQRVDPPLLRDAVVLQLQVKALRAEDPAVFQRGLLRAVVIAGAQSAGDRPGQAGRKGNEALGMAPEQVHVDAGFSVEALEKAHRDQIAQIAVTGLVFAEQNEMGVLPVHPVDLVFHRAGGDVDLAADDGLDAGGLGRLIEVDHAVHDAVVGDGDGGLAQLLHPVHQPADAAGAVQ